MLQQWVTSHSSSIIKRHNCIFFATIVTCHVWRLLVSYLKQAPWETLFKFKHNGRAAFRILGGDSPGQYGCSKSNVSTQVHWWPTPIFLRMTSLSVGIVIRRKNTRLSAVQKSVSMTTPVSKLPSHFCHGGWQKVSYHYFFFFAFSILLVLLLVRLICLPLSCLVVLLPLSLFSSSFSASLSFSFLWYLFISQSRTPGFRWET